MKRCVKIKVTIKQAAADLFFHIGYVQPSTTKNWTRIIITFGIYITIRM